MSSVHRTMIDRAGSRRFRWTSEEYHRLGDLGFFDRRRVELIRGEIRRMTMNPPHAIASERLSRILFTIFGPEFRVRLQLPLDLGRRDQPEPDAAILLGGGPEADDHPKMALLVIEVGATSLREDRTIMAHLYARAGIPDYWIVNLVDRQLEVHRDPGPVEGRRGRFGYRAVTIVPEAGNMAPRSAPDSPIAVADLLP